MLTGVIVARNGEKKIKECMKALDFCDETIVMGNTGEPSLNFSQLRNKALLQAKNEWVLYIDTDELISKELKDEILKAIAQPEYDTYYLRRQDEFWGKPVKYGEVFAARTKGIIRLVKKGSGTWRGRVHEVFIPEGSTGLLRHHLVHVPHESIAGFLEKINYYSTLRADELYKKGRRTHILEIIVYPIGKFLFSYLLFMGFRDGSRGYIYSFMMSFHSFLVRSKLFLLQSNA